MTFTTQSNLLITSRKFPMNFVELEPTLTKMYTEVAQVVNAKTNGIYETTQVTSGNRWFNTGDPQNRRQSFRKVFTFGSIAAGATSSVDHGITGIVQFVAIYGTCITAATVNPNGKYLPIPYASVTNVNRQIEVSVNDSKIFILNGAGADTINSANIVVEYLLN